MVNVLPPPIVPLEPVTHVIISPCDTKERYQQEIKQAVDLGFHHYYGLPDNIRWELLRLLVDTRQSFDFVAYIEQSLKKENQHTQEELC